MSKRQVLLTAIVLALVIALLSGAANLHAAEPKGEIECTALTTLKGVVFNDANNNGIIDATDEFEPRAGFFFVNRDDLSAPPLAALSGQRTGHVDSGLWAVTAVHSQPARYITHQIVEIMDLDNDGFPGPADPPPTFTGVVTHEVGAQVACGRHYVVVVLFEVLEHSAFLPLVNN